MEDLRQDEDCLDTWFSSWLWPISVFDGINHPDNADIQYYYPTNDLVTGPDILFFWVARMIISGYEYRKELCFKNVYLTGIVRDKQGRKMSKSLGNSPEPLHLIRDFGADGVRMGMMLAAPAGNDVLFDEALCEQGRNFNNKIWNAFRLVKGWNVDPNLPQPEAARQASQWFSELLQRSVNEMDDLFGKFRISEALMTVYKLFWDEFSSWYLELVKPAYQQSIDPKTLEETQRFFEQLLLLLHPFMPFITEELWQRLYDRNEGESIMLSMQPKVSAYNADVLERFEQSKSIVSNIRTVRLEKNIANKEALELEIVGTYELHNEAAICKLSHLETVRTVVEKQAGSASFLVGTVEMSVPLTNRINVEEELAKMTEEINYLNGFLQSVMKKLDNERFVANAKPEVVDAERKKKADAEAKMLLLQESIAQLKQMS
jgi:valyl-tRNA synthetase